MGGADLFLRGLDHQKQPGLFQTRVLAEVLLGSVEEEAVSGSQALPFPLDQVVHLALQAEDEFLSSMGDELFDAAGSWHEGHEERTQPLGQEPCPQALDDDAVSPGPEAFVLPDQNGGTLRGGPEELGDLDAQGTGQALQGGDGRGGLTPLDAADGIDGETALPEPAASARVVQASPLRTTKEPWPVPSFTNSSSVMSASGLKRVWVARKSASPTFSMSARISRVE